MTDNLTATIEINAPAEQVFAVLANPATHPDIDGTGWVRAAVDTEALTETGQNFRMSMYNENHPDGHYEMSNRVQILDAPTTISWEPGYDSGDGTLGYGGWVWRYDLTTDTPARTTVTLTYDWSAVPDALRKHIQFPPFPPEHLTNSLAHLAELV
jgi:uncharacterized protein YndB with AHSA1/START domain